MERDKSPTRAVKIPTPDECDEKKHQIHIKRKEESAKKKQIRIVEQREKVAQFLETSEQCFDTDNKSLLIRNELVDLGWHVDASFSTDFKDFYGLTRLYTGPIDHLLSGWKLNPVNDEVVELSIKATLKEEHHTCHEEIQCIADALKSAKSTFCCPKLSNETKKKLDEAGYACIEMGADGKQFKYQIIPKEQYDRVKAKISGK